MAAGNIVAFLAFDYGCQHPMEHFIDNRILVSGEEFSSFHRGFELRDRLRNLAVQLLLDAC
jgi:hypothetical protein